MRAEAQRRDPLEEAAKRGMAVSSSYSIPGRGDIRVATDRQFGEDYEAFARYVYANRHDSGKVRFINPVAGHTYASSKEQDKIAEEIASQEDVRMAPAPPPFSEGRERAEGMSAAVPRRRDDAIQSFSVSYNGKNVRIEIDTFYMGTREKEALQAAISGLGRRPGQEALFEFIGRYQSEITSISVGRTQARLDEGVFSDLDRLAGRA